MAETETESFGSEAFEAPETIRRMLVTTWALLYSLDPAQRQHCQFPMDDPGRLDWDFIPKPDRQGIPLARLDSHQRTLAHSLLAAGLSVQGYSQALQIMAMENMLREIEVPRMGLVAGDFRHQDQYFLAFFGRPGFEDTWGWRFLGHHLSLCYTIVGQRYLTVTPCNMGAQPASAGLLNPLGPDEDLGFALLGSLDLAQRQRAVIHTVAPADYTTRQVPFVGKVEYPDYVDLGIPWYQITDEDREALKFSKDEPKGVAAAVRWVRANAAAYGLDPDRVAGFGSSAGGYLIGAVALASADAELTGVLGPTPGESCALAAVVDHYAPTDFLRLDDDAPDDVMEVSDAPGTSASRFLGFVASERPGDADRARLSRYAAPDSPPFLIVHGDADRRVGLGQSRRLHAALREHGAQAELITVPGADHADPKIDEAPVREATLSFLATALRG